VLTGVHKVVKPRRETPAGDAAQSERRHDVGQERLKALNRLKAPNMLGAFTSYTRITYLR